MSILIKNARLINEGKQYEAQSMGSLINANAPIKVVSIKNNKVFVKIQLKMEMKLNL